LEESLYGRELEDQTDLSMMQGQLQALSEQMNLISQENHELKRDKFEDTARLEALERTVNLFGPLIQKTVEEVQTAGGVMPALGRIGTQIVQMVSKMESLEFNMHATYQRQASRMIKHILSRWRGAETYSRLLNAWRESCRQHQDVVAGVLSLGKVRTAIVAWEAKSRLAIWRRGVDESKQACRVEEVRRWLELIKGSVREMVSEVSNRNDGTEAILAEARSGVEACEAAVAAQALELRREGVLARENQEVVLRREVESLRDWIGVQLTSTEELNEVKLSEKLETLKSEIEEIGAWKMKTLAQEITEERGTEDSKLSGNLMREINKESSNTQEKLRGIFEDRIHEMERLQVQRLSLLEARLSESEGTKTLQSGLERVFKEQSGLSMELYSLKTETDVIAEELSKLKIRDNNSRIENVVDDVVSTSKVTRPEGSNESTEAIDGTDGTKTPLPPTDVELASGELSIVSLKAYVDEQLADSAKDILAVAEDVLEACTTEVTGQIQASFRPQFLAMGQRIEAVEAKLDSPASQNVPI